MPVLNQKSWEQIKPPIVTIPRVVSIHTARLEEGGKVQDWAVIPLHVDDSGVTQTVLGVGGIEVEFLFPSTGTDGIIDRDKLNACVYVATNGNFGIPTDLNTKEVFTYPVVGIDAAVPQSLLLVPVLHF